MLIFITILVTAFCIILIMNFVTAEKKIQQKPQSLYNVADPQFSRSISALLGPTFIGENTVEILTNGDEIFPAMIDAIDKAKHTITFETFIYWSGDIGVAFTDALSRQARAGLHVHVLLDWLGSVKMERAQIDSMVDAGVQIERYHKPHWSHLGRLNNRTHRKLLVIDGQLGFTGGVGIADQWQGNARNKDEWRDCHYKVTGPVVAQMQAVFMDNWIKSKGQILHDKLYFPELKATGDLQTQMFSSSPSGGSDSMHLMYLMAIAAASKTIELASAYFVPDELTTQALLDAIKRGVKVRIITPGKNTDAEIVRKASKTSWGKLLSAGIEISEYDATMYHCKIFIVDSLLVSVGSTNFNNRSFRLNDEANLNVLNADFAQKQLAIFNDDWAKAKPVTYEQWANRPLSEKFLEQMAAIFKSQL